MTDTVTSRKEVVGSGYHGPEEGVEVTEEETRKEGVWATGERSEGTESRETLILGERDRVLWLRSVRK